MANENELPDHPALKSFNTPWEYVKHVTKKAVKWAAVGAMVGGIAVAAVPGLLGAPAAGLAAMLGWETAATWLAGGVVKSFLAGALTIGGVTAGIGALSGLADAEDEVANRREDAIAAYERREVREQRLAMLDQRRQHANAGMAQDLRPNVAFGQSPDHEHGRIA